jgi:hypothetical protein
MLGAAGKLRQIGLLILHFNQGAKKTFDLIYSLPFIN